MTNWLAWTHYKILPPSSISNRFPKARIHNNLIWIKLNSRIILVGASVIIRINHNNRIILLLLLSVMSSRSSYLIYIYINF